MNLVTFVRTDVTPNQPGNAESKINPEIPDGKLVEIVLRGDKTAFEHFVHRYQRALLNLAKRRLQNTELAEEAVQETFLAAFKSLDTYDSQFAFRTWLWTILINQCRRIGSRNNSPAASLTSCPEEFTSLVSEENHPDQRALEQESQQRLQTLLEQITPVKATALRLRFFEGMKFHEIARQMNCSHSAAKQRVRLGLLDIAEKMKQSTKRESETID